MVGVGVAVGVAVAVAVVVKMTRAQVVATIEQARIDCLEAGLVGTANALKQVLDEFDSMPSKAASIMGSKGGTPPPKPGSRPRGRPRKIVDAMAGMEAVMSPESIKASDRIFEQLKADDRERK